MEKARPGIERLDVRILPSTFAVDVLNDGGAGSLRAAVEAANTNPGPDVIAFGPRVRGVIALTSGELLITDDVRIDGPGAGKLAISGNDASRVFNIAVGATVDIEGLTITRGRADRLGGGIWNSGTLTLDRVVVSDNVAVGQPGATPASDAMGGGVLNNGTITVRRSTFAGNRALGGAGSPGGVGSTGLGGALMSAGAEGTPATATITRSTFVDNQAVGGEAGPGATFTRGGLGGALMNGNGNMSVGHSTFRGNQAVGGAGGGFAGGFGAGGAIANAARIGTATLTVAHSTLTNNRAIGGDAPAGTAPQIGKGGAIANFIPPAAAPGGGVTATITHSLILGNEALGGSGPAGGTGQGGAISNENGALLTVGRSVIARNRAIGGAGADGSGGDGLGGGIFNGASGPGGAPRVVLDRVLVVLNRALGRAGTGGTGLGLGGGLYLAPGGVASARLTAIRSNHASTSDDDLFGVLDWEF